MPDVRFRKHSAKDMSTTEIGDALEAKIYNLLRDEIEADRFWLKREHCEVFLKKGYYSKDRQKDIIFDVSIEATLPGQDSYSLLVLIECKNVGRPVSVDDAEEFFAKIEQVAGDNVKGIIASTNSYQDGTVTYSRSKGFGLLRYFDNSNFKWLLPRSPSSLVTPKFAQDAWTEGFRGLAIESYRPRYFDFYGYSNEVYTTSLKVFFLTLVKDRAGADSNVDLAAILNSPTDNQRAVPYIDESRIEQHVDGVLRSIGYISGPVDLDAVCRFYEQRFGLKVRYADAPESNILGQIYFHPFEIIIFPETDQSEFRQRFTLAHELGHLEMGHGEYMSSEYCEETDFDWDEPVDLGIKDLMRMEWQANAFASCLLLPKSQFVTEFLRVANALNIKNRGFGMLYLDSQTVNIETFRRVSAVLKHRYRVSRSAIKVRLKKLGFLYEGR